MRPVKNVSSRIWSYRRLAAIKKGAEEGGYAVESSELMTEILDTEKEEVVLRALNAGTHNLVQLNSAYFEPINN